MRAGHVCAVALAFEGGDLQQQRHLQMKKLIRLPNQILSLLSSHQSIGQEVDCSCLATSGDI